MEFSTSTIEPQITSSSNPSMKLTRIILLVISLMIPTTIVHSSPEPIPKINQKELSCLSEMVYFESRGEPKLGMIATAHVALNRSKSNRFPNSVCKVISQKGQYSYRISGVPEISDIGEFLIAKQVAFCALVGHCKDPTNGALFFHNISVEVQKKRIKAIIGNHIFY